MYTSHYILSDFTLLYLIIGFEKCAVCPHLLGHPQAGYGTTLVQISEKAGLWILKHLKCQRTWMNKLFPRHHVGEHVRHAYSNTFNLKALEYAWQKFSNLVIRFPNPLATGIHGSWGTWLLSLSLCTHVTWLTSPIIQPSRLASSTCQIILD